MVTQPPAPNFNYVGLIGKPRFNDTAVLQDKNSKELLNVTRGDVVGGRFRVQQHLGEGSGPGRYEFEGPVVQDSLYD
jgi:hypothetical protein